MKYSNMRPVLGRQNLNAPAVPVLSVRCGETFNPGVYRDTTMNVFNMQELYNTLPVRENLRCIEQSNAIPNDVDMRNTNELVSGIQAILFKDLPYTAGMEVHHQCGISNSQFQAKKMVPTMSPVSAREPPTVCPVFPTGTQYSYSGVSPVPVSSHSMDQSIGYFNPVTMGENCLWMENNTRRVHPGKKTPNNVNTKTANDNTQWLYCKLCDCSVNSDYQMRIHNDGKKHQKKVEMTKRHTLRSAWLPEYTERLPSIKVSPTIDTWNDPQNGNSRSRSILTSHVSQSNIWCYQPNSPTHWVKVDACRRDDSDYSSANSDTDSIVSL